MQKSVYKGTVGGLFCQLLIGALVTNVTCGIMLPWAICYVVKYVINNSYINNRQLKFTGSVMSFFGNCLLWGLLTSVTCGIYAFWMAGDIFKWFIKNIHFADSANGAVSVYEGSSLRLGAYLIVTYSLVSVVLGPWLATLLAKRLLQNITIDGQKIKFVADDSKYLDYYLGSFVSLITCGIYSFWLNHYVIEWFVNGMELVEAPAELTAPEITVVVSE